MVKRSLRIPYRQGALTTRSNYNENWYAKTFPYEEGAFKWYAKKTSLGMLKDGFVGDVAKCFFRNQPMKNRKFYQQ